MKRYRLSRKAEVDTITIFIYEFDIQQAERYHDLLERTFQFLAENPEAARQRLEITPASQAINQMLGAKSILFLDFFQHSRLHSQARPP